MGYTTEFEGRVTIEPPLNEHEVSFLKDFNETRRMIRRNGPLFVKGSGFWGQGHDDDVIEFNMSSGDTPWSTSRLPADWREYHEENGQPGLWCQWIPIDDGAALAWDGGEKFYDAEEWMRYIIDKLLAPSASDYLMVHDAEDPRLAKFTYDHVLNGVIHAEGEEQGDVWRLIVTDNLVARKSATLTWD